MKLHFCVIYLKNFFKTILLLNSEAGHVLRMSLIFGKISDWCPYKLCPYKKKKCISIISFDQRFEWGYLAQNSLENISIHIFAKVGPKGSKQWKINLHESVFRRQHNDSAVPWEREVLKQTNKRSFLNRSLQFQVPHT